ncbi:MAG: hypothetical protein APF84_01295 [Gracilibacter sp. BRH_c7a]|nr:MAG: hypothetical protein APF84_01295 [Gracilibacter sp. BRH_c7a]
MKQKKKNKSVAYRGGPRSAKPVKRVKERTPMEPFTMFEKLLLVMFGISIFAAAASLFTELEVITYITIANYLILAVIILIRPVLILQILRKRTENFDKEYQKKELYLTMALRVVGVVFLGIAYLLLYNLGLVPNILPF